MISTPYHAESADAARLERGAVILIAVFWAAHFTIMWVRYLLSATFRGDLLEGTLHRIAFALIGAIVSYVLYRCLRPLRLRDFRRQTTIGAALAFVAACVQGLVNAFFQVVNTGQIDLSDFIYFTMYWFWFYFSWTAAYLGLSYSITVQEQERHASHLVVMAQDAQVRALRYQINPHFLFNTLNAIAALIRDAPFEAEKMVLQLSDFFRRTLAINPTEDVTLSEEVELQRLYLDIERTRFPDRLRFTVALDAGTAEARVPALLLQPLVENAVKHGVAKSGAPTCIHIRTRLDGSVLEIVVENDAQALGPGAKGEGVGLRNVNDRLRSRFGSEASLTRGPIAEGGFRNTLRMPHLR
ncbi:MAG TPA: histidine kinase [Allosphingosinicella sp.]|nr:histidine kinase [Allosphingosinicella sp.]